MGEEFLRKIKGRSAEKANPNKGCLANLLCMNATGSSLSPMVRHLLISCI